MTDDVAGALLLGLGFVSFVASLSQIAKLFKMKDTREFTAGSWMIFLLYQATSLVYSVSIGSLPYIILNVAWVIYYGLMLLLIVAYQKRRPAQRRRRA